MVITVEMYRKIRQMWLAGISQRKIADSLGIARNTVKKYCDGGEVPWERKSPSRRAHTLNEEVLAFIQACLAEDETHPHKKQKHTAKRIYDRLVEERGFKGGESTIRNLVRKMREKAIEAYVPLHFPAGDALQVDWGEAAVYLGGEKVSINLFCARLCYSGASIVFAYRRQTQESFLEALTRVFQYFGGVPRNVIFDNAKVAVKEGYGALAKKQDNYANLAAHYGFTAIFCNPASGNEKGLVEGLVGLIRRNVLVPIPKVNNLGELNELLLQHCLGYSSHHIRGRPKTVGEMLSEEKAALHPLPRYIPETPKNTYVRVDRYSTVRYETNDYSVPVNYCGKEVTIRATTEEIQVWSSGAIIAEHNRFYKKRESIYILEHFLPLLERKGRAIIYAKPLRANSTPEFLKWLSEQDFTPKELVALLRRCQSEGYVDVMKNTVHVIHPAIQDPVHVQGVDLSTYDMLCDRKAGVN